jgi:DNA polymerase-4
MYGIGKKTYPKLENLGIHTIGDFTKHEFKMNILSILSEQSYDAYIDHIMGRSSDIIDPKKYQIPQSISNETTLNYPMDHAESILQILKDLLEQTHERLIKEELVAKTIGIKLRTSDFETFSRGVTLVEYTDDYESFLERIEYLFETHFSGQSIRLVGIYLNQVIQKKDLKIDFNLFNYQEFTKREEALYQHKKVTL